MVSGIAGYTTHLQYLQPFLDRCAHSVQTGLHCAENLGSLCYLPTQELSLHSYQDENLSGQKLMGLLTVGAIGEGNYSGLEVCSGPIFSRFLEVRRELGMMTSVLSSVLTKVALKPISNTVPFTSFTLIKSPSLNVCSRSITNPAM